MKHRGVGEEENNGNDRRTRKQIWRRRRSRGV